MYIELWLIIPALIIAYAFGPWAAENKEYKKNQRESAAADWLAERGH